MSTGLARQLVTTAQPTAAATAPRLLQRKCASCGGATGVGHKCENCEKEERFGRGLLQPKLRVSTPDDPYEMEADRVAEAVTAPQPAAPPSITSLSAPSSEDSALYRKMDEPPQEDEERELVQTKPVAGPSPASTQGGHAARPATPAPASCIAGDLPSAAGAPLSPAARAFFEPRFGRDLAHVRIHASGEAARMSEAIGARAFTHGRDIYFAGGQYDDASLAGRKLLAHELAHVFQQGSATTLRRKAASQPAGPLVPIPIDTPANRNESAADLVSSQAAVGSGAIPPGPPAETAPSDGEAALPANLALRLHNPDVGAPVPAAIRNRMEPLLGSSLSHVRVHRGRESAAITDAVEARALTFGADIWLGEGESETDVPLMAHELTHVAQQSPRPLRPEAAERAGISLPPRLQTMKRYYYSLPNLGKGSEGPGSRIHAMLFPVLGKLPKNAGLFSEVPIPEGAATGSTGIADLLKTNTGAMFGVKFEGGVPMFLSLGNKTLKDGVKASASEHKNSAAPAGHGLTQGVAACKTSGLPTGEGICRMDQGPTEVKISDLKPNYEAALALGGDQTARYREKVNALGKKVNDYAAAHPTLVAPSGKTWDVTASALPGSELDIPADLENPTPAKHRQLEANLYVNDTQTRITETTALHVAKPRDGFVTYELIPIHQLTSQAARAAAGATAAAPRPDGAIGAAANDLTAVKDKLKEQPKRGSTKRRPNPSPVRRRLALKRDKLEAKDEFKFSTWKDTIYKPWFDKAKLATGGADKDALKTPTSEAEARMKDEALRQIAERDSLAKAPPADTLKRSKELERVQHWLDHGTVYGRLRGFFGSAYIKVVGLYDNVKAKVEGMADRAKKRMKKIGGGAGGIKGAVLQAVRGIASTLLGIMIRDVGHRLMTALEKGATVLVGQIFGDEIEDIEQKLKEIQKIEDDFQKLIQTTLEHKFAEQMKVFESKIAEIENIAATMRNIGTIVNAVKWAYRIAQCLAPPALGCLLGLVGSAIAEAILAAIIASCWFQREVAYPLVSKLGPVLALPGVIAKSIADRIRDLLPPSIKPLMGEVEMTDFTASPTDIDCDSTGQYGTLTPEQKRLAAVLDKYDPDQVDALLEALKHLGLIKDPPDPNDKMDMAAIDKLDALLKKYSIEQLREIIKNTPAQPPKPSTPGAGFDAIDTLLDGKTPPAGQTPPAAGGTGGDGEQPSADEIAAEANDVVRRMRNLKTYPQIGHSTFLLSFKDNVPLIAKGGAPLKAGDDIRVLYVTMLPGPLLIGGFQTITIETVGSNSLTGTIHAGTRFYSLDATYVDTSTRKEHLNYTWVDK
jgi:hypothetical protein